jgi:hypothetical protein
MAGMRIAVCMLAAFLIQQTDGCDQSKSNTSQPTVAVPARLQPYQRFVPMPREPASLAGVPWSGAFALDTKTGQLCLTYLGDLGDKWETLPQCTFLLHNYPD